MIYKFTKMKPFKLFVEFHIGINEASTKMIEKGCKQIDKQGITIVHQTQEARIPLSPPEPKAISF